MSKLQLRWGLLRQEERWEQLAWEAQKVMALDARWALPRQALCRAFVALGRAEDARREIDEAERMCPSESWAELRTFLLTQPPVAALPRAVACRKSRITVASLFCGEDFKREMRPARENHARWCALHGYIYACFEENEAGRADPTWSKIPIVRRLLREGAEYVFWMDADSLFIHDAVDLQWACDLGRDFVFAGDLNVVFNAGHFLARGGSWCEHFLESAFRIHPWPDWEDNGAMMIMLGGGSAEDPTTWRPSFERMKVPTRSREECMRAMGKIIPAEVAEHVMVVPQHRLNAYDWPGGGGLAAAVRGDPILHFAGCSAKDKIRLVKQFAGCDGDPSILWRLFDKRNVTVP